MSMATADHQSRDSWRKDDKPEYHRSSHRTASRRGRSRSVEPLNLEKSKHTDNRASYKETDDISQNLDRNRRSTRRESDAFSPNRSILEDRTSKRRSTAEDERDRKHRRRHESPVSSKRRRSSRSISPSRGHTRKSRRTSKSPRPSDHSGHAERRSRHHHHHRERSRSPRSTKKRYDTEYDRRSPDTHYSHRHRSRSPLSKPSKSSSATHRNSSREHRKSRTEHSDEKARHLSSYKEYKSSHRQRSTSPHRLEDDKRSSDEKRRRTDSDRVKISSRSGRHHGSRSRSRSRSPELRKIHRSRRESSRSDPKSRRRGRSQDSNPRESSRRQTSRDSYHKSRTRSPQSPYRKSHHGADKMRNFSPRPHISRNGAPPPYDRRYAPSPHRPMSGYVNPEDAVMVNSDARTRDDYTLHNGKGSEYPPPPRHHRPILETSGSYSRPSPYPASSHSASPSAQSPYTNGRGWGSSDPYHSQHPHQTRHYPPSHSGYPPSSYPPPGTPQGSYYAQTQPQHTGPYANSRAHPPSGYSGPPYSSSQQAGRSGQFSPVPDRRFSGPGPTYPAHTSRGRGGHFTNLHWNANAAGRGAGRGQSDPHSSVGIIHPPASPPPPPPPEDVEDNPFRPSKDLRVEDEIVKDAGSPTSTTEDRQSIGPPASSTASDSQDKGNKFSFAFKTKQGPPPGPKPDLAQKMRESVGRRDSGLSGEDGKNLGGSRYSSNGKLSKHAREPRTVERIKRTIKPKPYLPQEFVESDSVYFRKPGNESVVGSGTYGKVFKAIHVYTNQLVALKKIRMEGERDGFPVTAVREVKLLQSLRHENIVCLQEVMVEKNDCFMVFEYLSHDLTGLLNHPSFKLESTHKKHLAKQLFEGLDYLHRRGVLHRDIKAANILVSNEGKLKIADFGLARFFAKRRQLDYTNRVITIWYRSPELLLGETQYGPAVDIWSAACVLVEIFTKHAIFPGDGGEINQLDKIYNIMGTPTIEEWPGLVDMAWFQLLRPTEKKPNIFSEKYKERVTPAAFELLSSMFQYDPSKRPNASEVLQHPYFTTEEPLANPAVELMHLDGDWHEFESKALRKENERQAKEARRASNKDQQREKEKEKRRASAATSAERDSKRPRPSSSTSAMELG